MEIAYRKTVSHLDDLRYASTKVSDLLGEVNEQERKSNHVTYRNTHSALLFFVVSVILIYLLYKFYTYANKWTTIWFCR